MNRMHRVNTTASSKSDAQLEFAWSEAASNQPCLEPSQTPAESLPATEAAGTERAVMASNPAGLVQVLPWDFKSSFPEPLESAVEAGVLGTDEIDATGLLALHDEHARHALAILSDLE